MRMRMRMRMRMTTNRRSEAGQVEAPEFTIRATSFLCVCISNDDECHRHTSSLSPCSEAGCTCAVSSWPSPRKGLHLPVGSCFLLGVHVGWNHADSIKSS